MDKPNQPLLPKHMALIFLFANTKGIVFFALTILRLSSLRSDAAPTSARLQRGQISLRGDVQEKRAEDIFIMPGTLWCGSGNNAEDDSQLGEYADVDACCREHDHCPYSVAGFSTKDHYYNSYPTTVSHCDCDNKFFDCLKGVKDHTFVAEGVGAFYFDHVEPPCVKKEYGKYCKKWDNAILEIDSCTETAEGMAAIPYNYLHNQWYVADSVQEVLKNPATAIPPV